MQPEFCWNGEEMEMTVEEARAQARGNLGPYCKGCAVCDGRACGNQIPGPGAKGIGDTAVRNYEGWKGIRVNLDTISSVTDVDTSADLFGRTFRYPIFAGPVGAVKLHYGDAYTDLSYNNCLVSACHEAGIAAFTGDGVDEKVMEGACAAIAACDGNAIPTVKPWNMQTVEDKMRLVNQAQPVAVAMDVDAAGLPFLKNQQPPAGPKTVEQLQTIARLANCPFIVKGVMTAAGAQKAMQAGASAIVVSNHGGRVLDQCLATADVLEEIVQAVHGEMTVLVDGGIRTGVDVFKALALGADGVLICRPFVTMVYGGGKEAVKAYVQRLGEELRDTMLMCGAGSIGEITRDMVSVRNVPR